MVQVTVGYQAGLVVGSDVKAGRSSGTTKTLLKCRPGDLNSLKATTLDSPGEKLLGGMCSLIIRKIRLD